MFDHESSYTGYQIIYMGDRYYVWDDDEKFLTLYKMIINDENSIGIYNDYIKYAFDFNNPIKINKHHSPFKLYDSFFCISHSKIDDLRQKILSGDLNQSVKNANNKEYELGDVLSLNKSNHKIVYLWKDNNIIYHIQIRGGIMVKKVCIIKDSKIKRKCDYLTEEDIIKLLIDVQTNLKCNNYNDNYYLDKEEIKEKIDSYLKKYV